MGDDGFVENNPLRRWRRARGLTQAEVARMLRASAKSVLDWERGGIVPTKHFPALARLMEMDEPRLRGAWTRWRDRLRVA